jgi:hypothetical protein
MAEDVLDKGIEEKPDKEVIDDDVTLMDSLIGDKDVKDLEELEEKTEEEPVIEESDEDLLEVPESNRALDLKKIKEKYPDFAKTNEFRELRNAYHRESQYTELFPTLDDAKEAAENNDTFNKLNADIVGKGDVSSLLTAVKDASPDSLKKIALGFMDTLARIDQNLYADAIAPITRKVAKQIYASGMKILKANPESDDGKALVATARNITHFYFEDAELAGKDEPQPDTRITEKERELETREQAIIREKFQGAYSIAATSVDKNLDKQILQGLDPDGKLNEFVRDSLVEKIKKEVMGQIDQDQLHLRRMNSLWKRAQSEGYNRESLSRIVSAYLERARPIIPTVRNKFRSIAIGKGREREEESPKIVKGRSGRAPANDGKINVRNVDSRKIDYRNTSDDDIFEGKVKLKG